MKFYHPVLLILTIFLSCKLLAPKKQEALLYSNWKTVALEITATEMEKLSIKWPETWDAFDPARDFEKNTINSVLIEKNLYLIDSLVKSKKLTPHDDYVIVVKETFIEGFNSWHCTDVLLKGRSDKRFEGVEYCMVDPDPDSVRQRSIENISKPISYERKDIERVFQLRSGTFSSGNILVITELNKDYSINRIKVILYP